MKGLAEALQATMKPLKHEEGDTVTNEDGVAVFRRADGQPFMWMNWEKYEALVEEMKDR